MHDRSSLPQTIQLNRRRSQTQTQESWQCTAFLELMRWFEGHGIANVVVGDTRGYPKNIASDIDIVVHDHSLTNARRAIFEFARNHGMQVVQVLRHEQNAFYHVVAQRGGNHNFHFLKVDICTDYLRKAWPFLRADELLADRLRATDRFGYDRGFYVAAPPWEFQYYLLKKVSKRVLTERHGDHLSAQWRLDPTGAAHAMERYWSHSERQLIAQAAKTNSWEPVVAELAMLQRRIHRAAWPTMRHIGDELVRGAERVLHPTGLFVTFVGQHDPRTDKIIAESVEQLRPVFRHIVCIRNGRSASKEYPPRADDGNRETFAEGSHGKRLYQHRESLLTRRAQLVRSTLVAIDLIGFDLHTCASNTRSSLADRLFQLFSRRFQQSGLTIAFHSGPTGAETDPQVLGQGAKPVPRDWYKPRGAARTIDTSRPLDVVIAGVVAAVLNLMEKRTASRNRALLNGTQR